MTEFKQRFDIFICGGSQHVGLLQPLLERLVPYGTVHLASSFLTEDDISRLAGRYDVLHRPTHSQDGYANFELFCIKDVYRLATAPYFIKLDADVTLADDWIEYVESSIADHPHAVLIGPWKGDVDIDVELSGAPIRQRLHRDAAPRRTVRAAGTPDATPRRTVRAAGTPDATPRRTVRAAGTPDVRVSGGLKVIGGFCVARTTFFKERIGLLDAIHESVLSSRYGASPRSPALLGARVAERPARARTRREPITVRGRVGKRGSPFSEDTLRSLLVHAVDASDRLHVVDSGGRVRLDRRVEAERP